MFTASLRINNAPLMSARRNLNACQFSKVKLIEALSSVNEIDI